jgi:hypothetical protein
MSSEMMSIFLADFNDAKVLEKEISVGQYLPEMAITMLEEYMVYVRTDIETLEKAAAEELNDFNKTTRDRCEEAKKKIKAREGLPENAMGERRLSVLLINEELRRLKQEVLFIQKMAFRKGWLS